MPLAIYTCPEHGAFERLHRGPRPSYTLCPTCDTEAALDYAATMTPAKTAAAWGDSKSYFDRGLGQHIANSQERNRVMAEKGFVPAGDLAPHAISDSAHRQLERQKKYRKPRLTNNP